MKQNQSDQRYNIMESENKTASQHCDSGSRSSCQSQKTAAEIRRETIMKLLTERKTPLSASHLAANFGVSRQIIVSDVALLRASGFDISATPRGYIHVKNDTSDQFPFEGIIACKHTADQLQDELYTIVDLGGTAIDVTIEHSIYGQLCGLLDLRSRYDVDQFVEKIKTGKGDLPLSNLTGGIHLHRIGCRDQQTFELIKTALMEKGIVLSS